LGDSNVEVANGTNQSFYYNLDLMYIGIPVKLIMALVMLVLKFV
jgi:hypothetical protein